MKLNFNLFKKNKENEVFKCKHCKMTFQDKEKLDKHSKLKNPTKLTEAGSNLSSLDAQVINSATEAACMILRIDNIISASAPKSGAPLPGSPYRGMPDYKQT